MYYEVTSSRSDDQWSVSREEKVSISLSTLPFYKVKTLFGLSSLQLMIKSVFSAEFCVGKYFHLGNEVWRGELGATVPVTHPYLCWEQPCYTSCRYMRVYNCHRVGGSPNLPQHPDSDQLTKHAFKFPLTSKRVQYNSATVQLYTYSCIPVP